MKGDMRVQEGPGEGTQGLSEMHRAAVGASVPLSSAAERPGPVTVPAHSRCRQAKVFLCFLVVLSLPPFTYLCF